MKQKINFFFLLQLLRFKSDVTYDNLSNEDKKTADFCERNIHGLGFSPAIDCGPYFNQNELDVVLTTCLQPPGSVVGYKGNPDERKWIEKNLCIPFNLNDLQCPKVTTLTKVCAPFAQFSQFCNSELRCALNSVLFYKGLIMLFFINF